MNHEKGARRPPFLLILARTAWNIPFGGRTVDKQWGLYLMNAENVMRFESWCLGSMIKAR